MEEPSDSQWQDNRKLLEAINAAYEEPLDPDELAALEGMRRLQWKLLGKTPADGDAWTLDSLLAQVSEDNLHSEVETGPILGDVTW